MFDIGFSEIVLIMVIALVVLGPDKLPKLAADIGRWVGRARAMARQLTTQLEQDVRMEELARAQRTKPAPPPAETPAPETPAPETPAPETPAPETPAPETTPAIADSATPAVAPNPPAAGPDAPLAGAPTDEPHQHAPAPAAAAVTAPKADGSA